MMSEEHPTEPLAGDAPTRPLDTPAPDSHSPRLTPFPPTFYELPDINKPPSARSIWLDWIRATTLAGALAAPVAVVLLLYGQQFTQPPALRSLLAGALVGLILGAVQWRALRHYLPERAHRPWMVAHLVAGLVGGLVTGVLTSSPTLATTIQITNANGVLEGTFSALDQVAIFLALLFGPLLDRDVFSLFGDLRSTEPFLTPLFYGTLLGVAQWAVLRRYLRGAYWWLLANAAGGFVALAAGSVVGFPALMLFYVTYLCLGMPAGLLLGAGIGLPVGLLTGMVLAWLVRRSFPASVPAAPPHPALPGLLV